MPELDTYFETQLKDIKIWFKAGWAEANIRNKPDPLSQTRLRMIVFVCGHPLGTHPAGSAGCSFISVYIYTSDGTWLPRLPDSLSFSPCPANLQPRPRFRPPLHPASGSRSYGGMRDSNHRIHPPEIRILGWGGRTCLFVGGGLTRGALICFASLSVLIWFNPGFLRVSFGDFGQVSGSVYSIFVESSLFCSGCGRIELDLELTHRSWKFYHL